MKIKNIYLLLIWNWICLFVILNGNVNAQQIQDLANAENFKEKFYIVTDRSLYSAGENIFFSVFNLHTDSLTENEWSKSFMLNSLLLQEMRLVKPRYGWEFMVLPEV